MKISKKLKPRENVKKAVAKESHKMSEKKWSGSVTKESNALDLERGVFSFEDPKKIASSLKRSAEESVRRKGSAFQSAMSMLNFYINRAGKNLSADKKKTLEQAKVELRKMFGKQVG